MVLNPGVTRSSWPGAGIREELPERIEANAAMADDAELGMFGTMTTITYNDASPEMLAAIRRGPLAQPTEDEIVEYLDRAWSKDRKRLDFEQHAFEHVLSFQKRLHAFKRLSATELRLARASALLFSQIADIVMFVN